MQVKPPTYHFAGVSKMMYHFIDANKMIGDTAVMPSGVSSVAGTAGNMAARQPPHGSVVLRAKHASIGKSDRVERNSASFAQQADSMVAHRTMDRQEHTASDTVKVAKPPDLTWLSWAIIGGLIVVFAIIIWIEHE